MADPQLLQIPKHPDKNLLDCFINICKDFNVEKLSINVIGAPQIGNIDPSNKDSEILTFLFKTNGFLIETLTINVEGFNITFHRGGIPQYRGQSKEKSPFYDEIAFNVSNNISLDQFKRIEIVNIISTDLNSLSPGRSLETLKEKKQLESIHIATLEKLETLNEELIKTTNDYRIKIDERYSKKVEDYEENIRNKEAILEEEYNNKNSELDNKIAELEKKRKELDDRNNTHARRELRKEILKEIKKGSSAESVLTIRFRQLAKLMI